MLKLYFAPTSIPCRLVVAIGRMINVEIELQPLNLFKREHIGEDFRRINPFHRVPTLVDSNENITLDESRCICTYLVQKYSNSPSSSPLYPMDDLKYRIQIDRWLHFDHELYGLISLPFYSALFNRPIDRLKYEKSLETLAILNEVMRGHYGLFICHREQLSLADVSLYFTCNYLEILEAYYRMDDYPYLKHWYGRCSEEIQGKYDQDNMFKDAIGWAKKFVEDRRPKFDDH